MLFQSAVRIAVSLKLDRLGHVRHQVALVSIRRADRCLAEVSLPLNPVYSNVFQSAVRIAVSLKPRDSLYPPREGLGFNPPCGSLSR